MSLGDIEARAPDVSEGIESETDTGIDVFEGKKRQSLRIKTWFCSLGKAKGRALLSPETWGLGLGGKMARSGEVPSCSFLFLS